MKKMFEVGDVAFCPPPLHPLLLDGFGQTGLTVGRFFRTGTGVRTRRNIEIGLGHGDILFVVVWLCGCGLAVWIMASPLPVSLGNGTKPPSHIGRKNIFVFKIPS